MKKISLILAAVIAVVSLTVSPYAEEYTEVTLIVDGQEIESDQPAVIVDGRTMVPVRAIAEALGISIDYIETTKAVVFRKGTVDITLGIGNPTVMLHETGIFSEVELDSPAVIINGRTMVPVRFISEVFSAEVGWDADTKTVTVTSSDEEETGEPYYVDSELYYIAGLNDDNYEFFIFADGELVYEQYSGLLHEGKGSYGILPGETKPFSDIIEHTVFYGMSMEEITAYFEENGYNYITDVYEIGSGMIVNAYQLLK